MLILVGDIVVGAIGIASPAQVKTRLGVWSNMPSATTELMGNQSYRGVIRVVSDTKYLLGLEVGCVAPSNHAGAVLQLQYANGSAITHLNTTNFVNANFVSVFIDNRANWACPGAGVLHSVVAAFALPIIQAGVQNTVFMLRVVGSNGGDAGDNPRFSSVNVIVSTQLTQQLVGYANVITMTTFTAILSTNFVVTSGSGLIANFAYTATDGTTVQGQSGLSCTIGQAQTQCSSAITFPAGFLGIPGVTVSDTDAPSSLTVFAGEISLFSAETLTV
jgi:hypothetical protein